MTGKLAALGIDEDLELSGGEEENEDPAGGAGSPVAFPEHPSGPAAGAVPPPAPGSTPSEDQKQDPAATEDPGRASRPTSSAVQCAKEIPPHIAVGDGEEGEAGMGKVEDGELLEMLERPLQASRGRPQQQHESRDSSRSGRVDRSRKGGERKGGGGGSSGKARGRAKSNGRARGRNVTIKECARWMCDRLGEPKYYLMCRVVSTIGYRKTRALLERVQETQVRVCWAIL